MTKKLSMKEHQVYMDGSNGPFRCDNCEYYVGKNSCNEEHIISLAKKGKFGLTVNGDLTAHVTPSSCSDYFHPK